MQILNVICCIWPEIYGNQYSFVLGKERSGLYLKETDLQNVNDFKKFLQSSRSLLELFKVELMMARSIVMAMGSTQKWTHNK